MGLISCVITWIAMSGVFPGHLAFHSLNPLGSAGGPKPGVFVFNRKKQSRGVYAPRDQGHAGKLFTHEIRPGEFYYSGILVMAEFLDTIKKGKDKSGPQSNYWSP
jgi:hypothetical protein